MAKINRILSKSILHGKIKKGDDVTAFCGRPFGDILDYIYADSLTEGKINFTRKGIEKEIYFVKSNENDTLGLEFDESAEIKPIECKNNCIFCFVRQLPPNLRKSLYVRDDDYRLSFATGSYITGTNLKEDDIKRIIEYKLSPLYVSVHSTDDKIRNFILGVKKSPSITTLLKRLTDNGIEIHAQIVLVGGINDGNNLLKSLTDMCELRISTVAVVPVGLTSFREGKFPIMPLTEKQASEAIDITENFYNSHKGFCYCSDEMYQIAKRDVHDEKYYGDFEQIENGVGLIAKFISELNFAIENTAEKKVKKTVGIFTGVSGESTMILARKLIKEKFPDLEINIYVVINNFFGETVTVTGLVTASDIIKQYGEKKFDEDYLIIPSVMLKEFESVFLDGVSVKELSKVLKKKISVCNTTGESFLETVLYGRRKKNG